MLGACRLVARRVNPSSLPLIERAWRHFRNDLDVLPPSDEQHAWEEYGPSGRKERVSACASRTLKRHRSIAGHFYRCGRST